MVATPELGFEWEAEGSGVQVQPQLLGLPNKLAASLGCVILLPHTSVCMCVYVCVCVCVCARALSLSLISAYLCMFLCCLEICLMKIDSHIHIVSHIPKKCMTCTFLFRLSDFKIWVY